MISQRHFANQHLVEYLVFILFLSYINGIVKPMFFNREMKFFSIIINFVSTLTFKKNNHEKIDLYSDFSSNFLFGLQEK